MEGETLAALKGGFRKPSLLLIPCCQLLWQRTFFHVELLESLWWAHDNIMSLPSHSLLREVWDRQTAQVWGISRWDECVLLTWLHLMELSSDSSCQGPSQHFWTAGCVQCTASPNDAPPTLQQLANDFWAQLEIWPFYLESLMHNL